MVLSLPSIRNQSRLKHHSETDRGSVRFYGTRPNLRIQEIPMENYWKRKQRSSTEYAKLLFTFLETLH